MILKDKLIQPSSAMRHSAELRKILEQGDNCIKPAVLVVSDGSPDHNATFGLVKLALIALFSALSLDMLIVIRIYSYQSWRNMAEWAMATLNLALQNVSLARKQMEDEFEEKVRTKGTMKNLH